MKIAVLMTCYNRVEITLRCLRLLYSQNANVELSVYLVDDASPDKTGEVVKAEFPNVNVIPGTGCLYWSKGMALAWRMAGNDFDAYLWLNDDVCLSEGALQGLIDDADKTKWQGAIIGSFADGAGEMTYGVLEKWRWVYPDGNPLSTKGDISGNCVLIPSFVYDRIGVIADCYSHAYGDYDYSARMRKAGVSYYLASRLCGRCDDDKRFNFLKSKNIIGRLMCLFQPTGYNWRDAIVYRWKHYGLFRTLLTAIHVPYLVIKGKKRK